MSGRGRVPYLGGAVGLRARKDARNSPRPLRWIPLLLRNPLEHFDQEVHRSLHPVFQLDPFSNAAHAAPHAKGVPPERDDQAAGSFAVRSISRRSVA